MKHLVIFFIILSSMIGCSRQVYIPVENNHTDTLYKYKVKTDSVVFRDSVFVEYKTQGDTVFATRYVTKWRDRISQHIDTIYKAKTDTITKVQTIEVTPKRNWMDKLVDFVMSVLMMIVLAFVLIYGVGKWLKR